MTHPVLSNHGVLAREIKMKPENLIKKVENE